MKIVQLIYSLASGGGEKFVVDLSNQLASLGHDVTICILLDDTDKKNVFNKQFIDDFVKFHSLKFDKGFSLSKIIKVEEFIKKEHPDIVHCHLNVTPYIFRLSLTNKKIKFVHTIHNVAKAASGLKVQQCINKYFYSRGHIRPVTISTICKQSFEELYGLLNPPCIDNGRSKVKASRDFDSIRKEVDAYKNNDLTKVFVHVARCHPSKNQNLLVDVFNQMDALGVDFILLVIGVGFNSEEGELLKSRSCSRIHYLGEKSNVGDYLLCSDAFCLTSNYEGLPISLLEAFSCGLTPICTPVGGIPDVIKDGVTGYLSKDMTKEEYINAVCKFINKPIDKNLLIEYYNQNFSMEKCIKKYLEIYKK